MDLLTIDEVASVLRKSRTWTTRAVRSGELPSVKLGRETRVPRALLDEYIEGLVAEARVKASATAALTGATPAAAAWGRSPRAARQRVSK